MSVLVYEAYVGCKYPGTLFPDPDPDPPLDLVTPTPILDLSAVDGVLVALLALDGRLKRYVIRGSEVKVRRESYMIGIEIIPVHAAGS